MKPMRVRRSVVIILVALVGACGSGPSTAADAVPVYDATQVAFNRYVVIKRIGIEDWRSAFNMRGYPTLAAARQAVVNEAGGLGAEAVTNLTCFDQTDALFKPVGYFCYGNAVRVKRDAVMK